MTVASLVDMDRQPRGNAADRLGPGGMANEPIVQGNAQPWPLEDDHSQ